MTLHVLGYDPGAKHRWAALLEFNGKDKPKCVAVFEVGPARQDVKSQLVHLKHGPYSGTVIAVETPIGVAHGVQLAGVKGKGANLVETRAAAERFATMAFAFGFRVMEHSAAEVRQSVCLNKSAKDSVVRAAVTSNVLMNGFDTNVHGRDAVAVALFVGARLSGYQIKFSETGKAKVKSSARVMKAKLKRGKTKLPASVAKAMRAQGYLR